MNITKRLFIRQEAGHGEPVETVGAGDKEGGPAVDDRGLGCACLGLGGDGAHQRRDH